VKRIIAIYGASCSGKTTVAEPLAMRLGMELRNCGAVVRERAAASGVSPGALRDDEHRTIDAETRAIVLHPDSRVVIDGSFLDHVLAGFDDVWFVKLTASDGERERRYDQRGALGRLPDRDFSDEQLRSRLYEDSQRMRPQYIVDTTTLPIEEVVAQIARQWRAI